MISTWFPLIFPVFGRTEFLPVAAGSPVRAAIYRTIVVGWCGIVRVQTLLVPPLATRRPANQSYGNCGNMQRWTGLGRRVDSHENTFCITGPVCGDTAAT